MAKIGVQAMMLQDSFKDLGAFETLRKVNAIGYNAVEVSQIPMTAGERGGTGPFPQPNLAWTWRPCPWPWKPPRACPAIR